MVNVKGTARYDGAAFNGWQVQPGRCTVQGAIEDALATVASAPVRIAGAGRTDSGVHALGQVFSFMWPGEPDLDRLRRSLSRMLSPRVRIEGLEFAPEGFHARRSATGKHYAYTLCLAREPDPLAARYAWTVPPDLDMARLGELARRVAGRRDFAGFQGSGASVKTTVRHLRNVDLSRGCVIGPMGSPDLWRLDFVGDGFLYKMVRNITGTLVDVARGRVPESRIQELLDSPGPYQGHTAPGHGLTLVRVMY